MWIAIAARCIFEAFVNIKQILNICAFWPHFELCTWVAFAGLPPPSVICEYAHLICTTCTDRLHHGCDCDYGCLEPKLTLWPVTCLDACTTCTTCTHNQTCPSRERAPFATFAVLWAKLKTLLSGTECGAQLPTCCLFAYNTLTHCSRKPAIGTDGSTCCANSCLFTPTRLEH